VPAALLLSVGEKKRFFSLKSGVQSFANGYEGPGALKLDYASVIIGRYRSPR